MPLSMREMTCVTCGKKDYTVKYEARVPDAGSLNFSARREGLRSHPRIVECSGCGQIYSNPYFADDVISKLYQEANYLDEPQLNNMVKDYMCEFQRAIAGRDKSSLRILEVGCGDGFFLKALKQAGYEKITGVEPGREAVSRAEPDIRACIINDFFDSKMFEEGSFDIVCCFQIMDHLPNPAAFVAAVHGILAADGVFLAINHNIRARLPKLLGERSPMYDIEHIYLFDCSTMSRLLKNAQFSVSRCEPISNSYTVDYALKMFPFPHKIKRGLISMASSLGLAAVSLNVSAGNMVTVARR
ncbi:hypothetical protein GCM10011491_46590 [Brucella endophytica]|uniref:Class I SAM-dependent methyltransferase n=1 Tax=Brucella endophytica TaxID=1963359 RepID=A0A916SRX1_9HYPH|nr:class I SAM-dependent methyltransferase [Brucella endophytica]GGB13580.1 hypothetical protein GCM10011491_46590 [Brucella endophytica]